MGRVKTFTNGGSILPSDVNSIQDDYEFGFSTYKDILRRSGSLSVNIGASTVMLPPDGSSLSPGNAGSSGSWPFAFYIDPADYTANARANKYRLRAACIVNAVAPGLTFTFGMYPVASWNGLSGVAPTVATIGAVVSGSTVAIASPGVSAAAQAVGADFTAPAAGWYVLAFATPGSGAVNSVVGYIATLQRRQV